MTATAVPATTPATPTRPISAKRHSNGANAIEVRDLARNFKKIEAVKGVSFEVGEGELFGFLGPNGAGKTTTINMLCTLLKPSAGSAIVNGFDVATHRSEVRRSIGLVFQQTTLDDYLSAEQNLRFHAYAYNVPPTSASSGSRNCSRWSSCGTAAKAACARSRAA